MRAPLDVAWPPDARLHFAHPAVLHLTTMPYASITVTLRAVVEGGGLQGQPAAQSYRYTAYAQADRHGQAAVPLRYAYIPARPLHGILTVVARTAHETVQRSIPIELIKE